MQLVSCCEISGWQTRKVNSRVKSLGRVPAVNWDFTAIYPLPALGKAPVLAAEPSEKMDVCLCFCLSSAQLGALVHIHPHQSLKLIQNKLKHA